MRRFALLAVLLAAACAPRQDEQRIHAGAPVIIISIDTLRADHLPMFGYDAVETPHLDAFRRDAILFRSAYAHVPLTLPSHVSILTGQLPPQHKVRSNIGYLLDPAIPTIPRMLKERGYDTGAAVSAYVLRGTTGLRQAFDFYDDGVLNRPNVPAGLLQRPGQTTAAVARDWIAARGERPFFFLFHIFEPHTPYEPPEPFRSMFSNPYDGEIAAADAIVGSFLEELKRSGIYDRAIIVVLSDHGEGLGDHGETEHGIFLYREAIHVPLLMKLPNSDRAGETVGAPVGLIDLLPTIADLTGSSSPILPGRSLLAAQTPARRIYSESLYPRIHLGWSELRSLVDARHHFIQAPKPELYDIVADPAERNNILGEERRSYAAMREELARYGSEVKKPSAIDPEEEKKLAALGYLSSAPQPAAGPLPDPKDRIGEIAAMTAASELLRQRRYGESIDSFRRIVQQNPRLSDAWNQLGTALETAGRYEEASEAYKTAIERAPELAGEFGLRRASVLLKLERFDEAEKHASLAEKTNPSGMALLLARTEMGRKNFTRAEERVRTALNDPNERLSAEILLAQIYVQQERLDDAAASILRAQEQIRRDELAPVETFEFVRGDILARMERYEEAIQAFRREIEHFPANRQPYANLYLVYMVTGRADEGRQTLEQMVRANPSRATYLFAARTADTLGDQRTAAMWRERAP